MAGLVTIAPLQTIPKVQWFYYAHGISRVRIWTRHNRDPGIACLCSIVPGVSAEKTQELGVTWQLGARMTWKCFYSYVWGQMLAVCWDLSLASNYMWPSCSLSANMVASGQLDFLAGGSTLQKWMSQWTRQKWHYLHQPSLENHIASFHCTPFVKAVVSPSILIQGMGT